MKVAIIGCSTMGRLHASMAAAAGLEVTVCADTAKDAAADLAKVHEAEAASDPVAAIERNEVDVVCIATPTPYHEEYVCAAAAAGKHIFCEKPFCRTVQACKNALAAVKKARVKLFVGHVVRYFQEFDAMKAQVESGVIGNPGFVKIYRGGIMPGGPDGWFADYKKSGGVVLDCMIHDLDWVRYVFGEPERIYCQALLREPPQALDYAQATMRMKSGMIATFVGTWAHPSGFQVKTEICGDGGMLTFDSNEVSLSAQVRESGSGPNVIVPGSPVDKSPYQREWEDFAAWLEHGRKPRVHPEDGLKAVRMAEAALESAEKKKPVRI